MQFTVTTVARAHDLLLQVTGELDIATVAQLREAVDAALAAAPPALVLDLSPTRFIDSTGCREVIKSAKAAARASVPASVVVPPDNWRVRRVVEFVQLSAVVPVHDVLPDGQA